jgi:hypothetical protein
MIAKMQLGLCLLLGTFRRFDFSGARYWFNQLSSSDRFAAFLHDSLLASDYDLVAASDFARLGSLFSILPASFDDSIPLIRVLNDNLSCIPIASSVRFAAWQEIARYCLDYLVDVSPPDSKQHGLDSLPSDLLSCDSISAMIPLIVRMYTRETDLYRNVNHFLRSFPILIVSKFMRQLQGILRYIYLLQSSIEYISWTSPIDCDLTVYRGISQGFAELFMLYDSMIGKVIIWPGFTSTSTDKNHVIDHFITDADSALFKIELHAGDTAVWARDFSEYVSESEVLIAASSGFLVKSVSYKTVTRNRENLEGDPTEDLTIPFIKLSYFLHWTDFNLDQRPAAVIV